MLDCRVGGLGSLDPRDPNNTPKSCFYLYYIPGAPATDGRDWFGRLASDVPSHQQRMLLQDRAKVLIDLGNPKLLPGLGVYQKFSTENVLTLIRRNINNTNLVLTIGNASFEIDDEVRRSLFLFDRAVAVLRYRMGSRDAASRPSLGD